MFRNLPLVAAVTSAASNASGDFSQSAGLKPGGSKYRQIFPSSANLINKGKIDMLRGI